MIIVKKIVDFFLLVQIIMDETLENGEQELWFLNGFSY